MSAILNSLNAHNLPILHPILIILVSKFMVHRALSDKTYLSLGLLSPLILGVVCKIDRKQQRCEQICAICLQKCKNMSSFGE